MSHLCSRAKTLTSAPTQPNVDEDEVFLSSSVKTSEPCTRTLTLGLIANRFHFVLLELVGGFGMPQQLLFVEYGRLRVHLDRNHQVSTNSERGMVVGERLIEQY